MTLSLSLAIVIFAAIVIYRNVRKPQWFESNDAFWAASILLITAGICVRSAYAWLSLRCIAAQNDCSWTEVSATSWWGVASFFYLTGGLLAVWLLSPQKIGWWAVAIGSFAAPVTYYLLR